MLYFTLLGDFLYKGVLDFAINYNSVILGLLYFREITQLYSIGYTTENVVLLEII